MSCNHKWVYMEDGTGNKGCTSCGIMQMNAQPINIHTNVYINDEVDIQNIANKLYERFNTAKRMQGVKF